MGKVKELVRTGWSRWYVRVGLAVSLITLVACPPFASREVISELKARVELQLAEQNLIREKGLHLDEQTQAKLHDADSMITWQENLTDWQFVLGSGLVAGYLGFSLDAGYHWLRKRRQQSKKQEES